MKQYMKDFASSAVLLATGIFYSVRGASPEIFEHPAMPMMYASGVLAFGVASSKFLCNSMVEYCKERFGGLERTMKNA